ncbi:MAG: hypothetical protein NTZ13_03705 [Candidatus Parcubacteria bacterium]|nr:hypothetical protein [Candidatus Parcubacteria bacterium]
MTDKKEKDSNMSLEDLAQMMQAGFQGLEERLGGRIDRLDSRMDNMEIKMERIESRMDGIESRMDGLESRMGSIETRIGRLEFQSFTNEEKEEVLAMVRHYDKRLELETLGKDFIVLTREEYNIFVKIAGISNRFEETKKEYA